MTKTRSLRKHSRTKSKSSRKHKRGGQQRGSGIAHQIWRLPHRLTKSVYKHSKRGSKRYQKYLNNTRLKRSWKQARNKVKPAVVARDYLYNFRDTDPY